MRYFLKSFLISIGMDKAIAYSSGSRIAQGITGVLSVFFISTYLTGIEQGFYYTFGSILALQVFFELGLTSIMTQYVAHEVSHLSLNHFAQYEGEELYISRLASLVRFCFRWYIVVSIFVFFFLLIIGYFFFNSYGDKESDVDWGIPWILVCLGTAIKLFQSPFNSILLGVGKVKEMSQVGFYQQIIMPLSLWLGLIAGLKLYIVGISYIMAAFVWQLYLYRSGLQQILLNLWRKTITEKVSYVNEILPYQWRIALSWVSGYFIFQLFNPVLFATEGPVVSGQMGMTLHALNAIQSFSMSWLNTKVPHYSQLIALKQYTELDNLFQKTLKQMTSICLILLLMFFSLIIILNISYLKIGDTVLADRFLGYWPTLLMMIPVYLQQYINSWATYLRCHKKEPFLVNSICCGIVSCISTFVFGNMYGLYGVTIGYFTISVIFFPWGYYLFRTYRNKWHNE